AVKVARPNDARFLFREVVARVEAAGKSAETVMQDQGGGVYTGKLDALALLGNGVRTGDLRVTYRLRGATYDGHAYPDDWWLQDAGAERLVRVANVVTVEAGTADLGWLRRRSAPAELALTLTCRPCEQQTPLVLRWDAASAPVLPGIPPLQPEEVRPVTASTGGWPSALPAAVGAVTLAAQAPDAVRGGVDFRMPSVAYDNRSELDRLWNEARTSTLAFGLLGAFTALFGWEAPGWCGHGKGCAPSGCGFRWRCSAPGQRPRFCCCSGASWCGARSRCAMVWRPEGAVRRGAEASSGADRCGAPPPIRWPRR
ncbi:MAG: hypothetical protein NTZ05_17800, partial [Chloroflexi bacterium]|nr:hypothetical protein [Chloroflexota bacterium]